MFMADMQPVVTAVALQKKQWLDGFCSQPLQQKSYIVSKQGHSVYNVT